MVDKWAYVNMVIFTKNDSYNNILKYCTPYAEHQV